MTSWAAVGWAAIGALVGVLQARSLFGQASARRGRPLDVFARVAVVTAFAFLGVRARAATALVGWTLGYSTAVGALARETRGST